MHLCGLTALMNLAKVAPLVVAVEKGYAWVVTKSSVSTAMMGVYFLAVYSFEAQRIIWIGMCVYISVQTVAHNSIPFICRN
jgi:hypothetical protein